MIKVSAIFYLAMLEYLHEGADPIGIFSSREKAIQACFEFNEHRPLTWEDNIAVAAIGGNSRYHIYEMVLDEPSES